MSEGREIKLHACRRKPSGVFVGRDGGCWALIRQRPPFTVPDLEDADGCWETLSGKDGKK